MTASQIIAEIVSLSPEEQEEVLHFARGLDTGSALAGRELAALAEKLSGTDDERQAAELRSAIAQGFYGRQ